MTEKLFLVLSAYQTVLLFVVGGISNNSSLIPELLDFTSKCVAVGCRFHLEFCRDESECSNILTVFLEEYSSNIHDLDDWIVAQNSIDDEMGLIV